MLRSAPRLRRDALLIRGRDEIDFVMRGFDPRIHHLRETLFKGWMAGSSPRLSGLAFSIDLSSSGSDLRLLEAIRASG
jgi:hypothetical protein